MCPSPPATATARRLRCVSSRRRRINFFSSLPLFYRRCISELKLRWYRSKSVIKYPRCSIRRQLAYVDAEVISPHHHIELVI
ncbi:hypothetical protein AAHE18_08G021100 [Arachis hypogaea]